MKKLTCIIMVLVTFFVFCACGTKEDKSKDRDDESPIGNGMDFLYDDEYYEDTTAASSASGAQNLGMKVSDEFIASVCDKWQRVSGMYYDYIYMELREDGTCMLDDEQYTWDATYKMHYWQTEPVEYVNIYKNGELIYEAYLGSYEDREVLTFGFATDPNSMGAVPASHYARASTCIVVE